MNKAFELILERLEQCQERYDDIAFAEMNENGHTIDFEYANGKKDSMDEAEKIVQKIAEEYNNGWISCSERLPEIRQDCLVTVRYTGFMGMHGFWVKTGHMESENDWWGDCSGGEVIAWQPLPEPYHPKGE